MTLRVSGKNLHIGESLREHARDRVGAVIGRYFEGEPVGHVTVEPEGSSFRADLVLHLPSGITLQAESRAHDPYAVVNQAVERIETRLRRHKHRLTGRHSPPAPDPAAEAALLVADYVIEAPGEDGAETVFSPVIVAETRTALRALSVSAAVLELDLSGVPVLVFRHATTASVNIVYRRSDGHIGWIDPSGVAERA